MIVFDLECRTCSQQGDGHRFEGWFGSSDDYARQQERGLVTCPTCGSADVGKAVMAPAVGRKGNQLVAPRTAPAPEQPQPMTTATLPPQAVAMFKAMAAAQAEALKASTWVGTGFADDARAMHYGEKDVALIHGQATPDEARDLIEEGIEVSPILFPIAPPTETN